MSFSTIGHIFRVTTWGESHGEAIGAIIDGCPPGVRLSTADFDGLMARRSGKAFPDASTTRREPDAVNILSGVFDGVTTGTPISLAIANTDAVSADYEAIKDVFRPSHADYTYDKKYGIRDYRGGGRASGRETAARVAAGAVAMKLLSTWGISVSSRIIVPEDANSVGENDSYGAVCECIVSGCPAGLGEPVFSKLDAELAKAIFSIGGVKAVGFGAGVNAAGMSGTEYNDQMRSVNGVITKLSNNSGGITGGISEGFDIVFQAAFKPTPSIGQPMQTVDKWANNREIEIKGRHDRCFAYRAAVVVECMAAFVIADMMMMQKRNEGV